MWLFVLYEVELAGSGDRDLDFNFSFSLPQLFQSEENRRLESMQIHFATN